MENTRSRKEYFNAFNILVGSFKTDECVLSYYCNRENDDILTLDDGVHGLSNQRLDSTWGKVSFIHCVFNNNLTITNIVIIHA